VYQIMKITIYLSIALMLMVIQGCPSDRLASSEVCSGEAPYFKLFVVSDTDATFDIQIQSVGQAVHKTTREATQFNPITGVGMTFVHKTRVSRKGDIINAPFKPSDIHKNNGCIKQYTVSVDVSASWQREGCSGGRTGCPEQGSFTLPPSNSSVELSCLATEGKQIKGCFFKITIDKEEKKLHEIHQTLAPHEKTLLKDVRFHRAYVATTSRGGTLRLNTFVSE
jgi:hypothetical protein